jgi:hypothetical protein
MSGISNLKPIVQSKLLIQSNSQTVLNGLSFTSVTAQFVSTDSPDNAQGSNGNYYVETDVLKLYVKSGGSWGAVSNGYYIITSTDGTYNSIIYQVTGGSGDMSLLTAGRYIPTNASTPYVYTISSTGSYTATTYVNGQLLSSPTKCYCLINDSWTALN